MLQVHWACIVLSNLQDSRPSSTAKPCYWKSVQREVLLLRSLTTENFLTEYLRNEKCSWHYHEDGDRQQIDVRKHHGCTRGFLDYSRRLERDTDNYVPPTMMVTKFSSTHNWSTSGGRLNKHNDDSQRMQY